jgi:hypothetical protein
MAIGEDSMIKISEYLPPEGSWYRHYRRQESIRKATGRLGVLIAPAILLLAYAVAGYIERGM